MTRQATPASVALTARIVELHDAGLTWAQIGTRLVLSRQAARARYLRALRTPHVRAVTAAKLRALRGENKRLREQLAQIRKIVQED